MAGEGGGGGLHPPPLSPARRVARLSPCAGGGRPGSGFYESRGGASAALVYKLVRSAMKAGSARTKEWLLEYEASVPRQIDPLMGWTSSSDTRTQLRLEFDTKEEAIAYAERNGIPYRLDEPKPRGLVRKSYADNFKFGRLGTWTH